MKNTSEIDRDSFEPAYSQLANILRHQIAAGKFREGGRLPSEAQLCKRYGVSSMTVRRSINILLDQGIVSTIRGKGTFVKSLKIDDVTFGLKEFSDLFKEDVSVKLLEVRIVSADAEIGKQLEIDVDTKTIYIRRLLSNNSTPVLYHQEYLIYDPCNPIVESEMEAISLKGLFTGGEGTTLKGGELIIEAIKLNKNESQLLECMPSEPAFRLTHVFKGFDDKPVSWGWFICRGKDLCFRTSIGVL